MYEYELYAFCSQRERKWPSHKAGVYFHVFKVLTHKQRNNAWWFLCGTPLPKVYGVRLYHGWCGDFPSGVKPPTLKTDPHSKESHLSGAEPSCGSDDIFHLKT